MKKLISILLAMVLLCSFALADGIEFAAKDMEGNTVTHEIFADYDLTMVNIWATWCGYCIQEMPHFAALKDSLPEGGNLITICEDAESDPELVNLILEACNANFTTIAANQNIYNNILRGIYSYPTTFFVNSEGRLVGDLVVGVPSLEDPAGAYLAIFEERMAMLAE